MDNRIDQLSVGTSLDRTAVKTDFGALLARSLVSGASVASSIVPGGAVISAAINQTAGRALAATSGARAAGGGGGSVGAVGTPAASTASAGGSTDLASFQDQLSADKASDMQYLALQHQMQQESQVFNSVSNIMKVRAESAKTAINNIR